MNTRELESDLAAAIDDDRRRTNVNSAKLRASSQAVPYEQFKQFVAAANLRPLDKDQNLLFVKDRKSAPSSAGSVPYLDKPTIRTHAEHKASRILSAAAAKALRVAKSFSEFEKLWNSLAGDVPSRAALLALHSEADLVKIFSQAAFDFALLGDLLNAIAEGVRSATEQLGAAAVASATNDKPSAQLSCESASASTSAIAASSASCANQAADALASLAIGGDVSASNAPPPSQTLNALFCVLKVLSAGRRFSFTYSCLGAPEKGVADGVFALLRTAVGVHVELAFGAADVDTVAAVYK